MNEKIPASKLLKWFRRHGRKLPWRNHPDPYAVWVSEIMLQQTRVETAIPYFERWMKNFPTVSTLARAEAGRVLNLWEGLGYYSRARNLHQAARIVMEKHAGILPSNLDELRSLPGIGRYTAGAIASMAFGLDEPTLDGNLRRVFARVFDISAYADSPAGEGILWDLAAKNLPRGRAGIYNEALMDLGATVCLPRTPRCLLCPLKEICKARQNGTQKERPVLKPKKSPPHYTHAAGVVMDRNRVLLAKRPEKGLLGGMWEFPNGRVKGVPEQGLANTLNAGYRIKVKKKEAFMVVTHAYTHFKVTVHAFRVSAASIPKSRTLKWVRLSELEEYPMGKVDRQIARKLNDVR